MRQLLLMNPNSNAATTRAMLGIAQELLPDLRGWTAPEGPGMIVSEAALEAAAGRVASADLPQLDGIIVAAFGDPGADALAERLACPVVGIGAAAAQAAGQGGRAFAVVTTTPGLERGIDRLMRANTGTGRYLGCHFTQGDPLALMRDDAELDRALSAAVARAAAAGAEVAIIGGGPLGEAAERLKAQADIPLIAPLRAAALALRGRLHFGVPPAS